MTPARTTSNDTGLFFWITLPLCLVSLLPAILARAGVLHGYAEEYLATAPIAVLSPTIGAVIASRREGGREGIRALFRQFRAWRRNPFWYVLAIALPGLVFAVGRAVVALVSSENGVAWAYFPTTAQHIAAMIVVPIGEEIGWRGFALPRLQRRYGAIRASVILGVLWALWHIPMFVASGATRVAYETLLLYFIAGSFMFTWMYNRTGGSLPLAIMLHVGAHLDSPGREGVGNGSPLVIMTASLLVLAVVLVYSDPKAFSKASDDREGATNE